MDERLSSISAELDAGTVTPYSLVLLFNTTSEAEQAGVLTTLEPTLELARAIAETAGEPLRVEAQRLAGICEQNVRNVRERTTGSTSGRADGMIACPDCG